MFHSQTWLSIFDAAPKLNASALPWLLAALVATWLVLFIAIEHLSPRLAVATEESRCGA